MTVINIVDRTGKSKEYEVRESYSILTQCINAPARFVFLHLTDDTPVIINKHFITYIEGTRND
jgi:hypothetical protein